MVEEVAKTVHVRASGRSSFPSNSITSTPSTTATKTFTDSTDIKGDFTVTSFYEAARSGSSPAARTCMARKPWRRLRSNPRGRSPAQRIRPASRADRVEARPEGLRRHQACDA